MGIPANRQLSSGPIGAIHCGRALPPLRIALIGHVMIGNPTKDISMKPLCNIDWCGTDCSRKILSRATL